jgi:hypothetical protein
VDSPLSTAAALPPLPCCFGCRLDGGGLVDRKKIALGTKPILLRTFRCDTVQIVCQRQQLVELKLLQLLQAGVLLLMPQSRADQHSLLSSTPIVHVMQEPWCSRRVCR